MDKKKIEDFITRLSDPNLPEEQQSFILQSEDDDVCAGDNTGTSCTNRSEASCGVGNTNKKCTNYEICGGSDNTGECENFEPKPVNIPCLFPINTDRGCS